MTAGPLATLDLVLRSGVCTLLALIAAVLLRDHRREAAARVGGFFMLSAIAYLVSLANGVSPSLGPWSWALGGLAVGVNLLFWLFARTLFDDGFRPGWAYVALWAAIVLFGAAQTASQALGPSPLARALGTLRALQAGGFALAAAGQTIASWRADLVEPRRRLRVFVVAAAFVHTLLTVAASVAAHGAPAPIERLADVAAVGVIALVAAWALLRVDIEGVLARAPQPPRTTGPRELDSDERLRLAELTRLMQTERLYRQESLSIGALAQRVGVPEYRLRRLINGGLGYRNFNAFLNSYRLGEAKDALADPSQAEVPILTIALDAGFNSLGPFNRAFKAETGMTPSEFRRIAGGARADSGEVAPFSASRISKSA